VKGGRVTQYDGNLIPLWTREKRPPSSVSVIADSMQREIDGEYDKVICTLKGNWMRSETQSAIGTFLADAQREAAGAEVGFMNNGGIRRDVLAGPLTKKTLFEVLPFRNILATFQLTGKQLRNIMVYNIAKRPGIQIAGMSGRWRKRPDGSVEFTSIEVGGKPLDEKRSYPCAASDFFVGEGKKYLGEEIAVPLYLGSTVFEAVDKNFQALFTRMFGGGRAHLALVGSDVKPLLAAPAALAGPHTPGGPRAGSSDRGWCRDRRSRSGGSRRPL